MSEPCPNCGRSKATNSEGWLLSPRTLCFRDVEGLFAMFTSSDCVVVERARLRARVSELEEQLSTSSELSSRYYQERNHYRDLALKSEGTLVPDVQCEIIRTTKDIVLEPGDYELLEISERDRKPGHVVGTVLPACELQPCGFDLTLWLAGSHRYTLVSAIRRVPPLPAPPDAGKETT